MKKSLLLNLLMLIAICLNAQTTVTDSLENLLNQHTEEDTIRVNLLNETALKLYPTNIDKTLIYAEEAIMLADKLNYIIGRAESLRAFGIYHWWKGNYPLALDYAQESLEIKIEIKDKKGISNCYIIIGLIQLDLGNYSQALLFMQKSLKIKKEIDSKNGIADCFNNIGIIYSDQGNNPQALEYYQKSLKISEELGDEQRISNNLINIGSIHSSQKSFIKALEYYQRSMNIFKEIGDKQGISYCLNNIGNIHKYQGNYSQAKDYYQKSLKIKSELEDKKGISTSFNNLGQIHLKQEIYSQAIVYFKKALEINEEIGNKSGICFSYEGIGTVYFETNNYIKALDYSFRSLKIAKELGLLDNQKTIYEQISEIYASIGKYNEAYKNYVLYKELNDSIFNEENIKKITGLEYQYEFDKVKQAIELEQQKNDAVHAQEVKYQKIVSYSFIGGFVLMLALVLLVLRIVFIKRKANNILKKQKQKIEKDNQLLKELNNTKDKFFTIIAHDLRGPLGNLNKLGELLWKSHDKFDTKKQMKILESLASSAKVSFNLLDNLLKWASSNSGRMIYNPDQILLNDIVQENFKIFKTYAESKKVKLISSIKGNLQVYADFDMINTVIRNLLSNAVKFTPDNGRIEIITKKGQNSKVEIGVSDSGIGIKKEVLSQLFELDSEHTSLGTNMEKGSGLGLKLCKEFIERNKGNIWIESEEGIGTIFWISLPTLNPELNAIN